MKSTNIKKYLKWYIYPVIYFAVSSLVCLYAWFANYPKYHVKIVFNTIALIPSILGISVITVLILILIVLNLVSSRFIKSTSILDKNTQEVSKVPQSIARKMINSAIYSMGSLLVITGILLFVWVTRPYLALLFSYSKIEALENKVTTGQIQGNRIIIPSILVDAPILEGATRSKMTQGVCHHDFSAAPGEGGNCIIEGHNLAEFGWWKPQSFFSLLEIIRKGDLIYVFYKGKRHTYRVKDKTYKAITDPSLYDTSPGERLTLLTCVSTWSPTIYSNKRTVITAYPVF